MPPKSTPTTRPIGGYLNVLPDGEKSYETDTTVLTPGSVQTSGGAIIALLHIVTWVVALLLISLWGNSALDKITEATDAAKMLGNVYAFLIIGILVMVVVHSACAIRPEKKAESWFSSLMSVLLLTLVGFENALGVAYLAYSLQLGSSNVYSAAITSQLFVCLGSSMIVAFYVNWSHYGDGDNKDVSKLLTIA